MKTFHLIVSTPSAGIEDIKIIAESHEDAAKQFESDSDNDGLEVLHVIEAELPQIEIVIDMTGGLIEQVFSNHENTKIIFLDSHKEEVAHELESDGSNFAPDVELNDEPDTQLKEPWVFRECDVDHNPSLTQHYIAYSEDEKAREAFNTKVHEAFDS